MATVTQIDVIDQGGTKRTINTLPDPGPKTAANSLSVTIASDQIVPVRVLLAPGVGRALTTTNTTANTPLTQGIKAVSIYARNSDAYFSIGNSAQTATASSAFIAAGERLDFDVSAMATPNIAVIFGPTGTAAILQVTELS